MTAFLTSFGIGRERTMLVQTNLEVLAPSRKPPAVGDVFALRPKGRNYMFGRVIRKDARVGGFPGILVYIYRATSPSEADVPALRPSELLVPPLATNRQPWTRGYFHTIAHAPLTSSDVLSVHCFRHPVSGRFLDEYGEALSECTEPIGTFAFHSYRTIDDEVSDALSIARVPD